MSGDLQPWVAPENAGAFRAAAADLDNHVPHYTDAAGRTHSVVAGADNKWLGLAGNAAAAGTQRNAQNVGSYGPATQRMADTLRAQADHIDRTNALAQNLHAQRVSDLAAAKTPAERLAANQNYAKGVEGLQNSYKTGASDLNKQLGAAAREAGGPQPPGSQLGKTGSAPPGTGVTPGKASPNGVPAGRSTSPGTNPNVGATKQLAAYGRGGALSTVTSLSGTTSGQSSAPAVAAHGKQQSGSHSAIPAPVPLGAESEKAAAAKPTAGMSAAVGLGHRALASMVAQFRSAGWATDIAVAVARRRAERRVVYTTPDAVSVWPRGALIPDVVLPLDRLDGVDAVAMNRWMGFDQATPKLSLLAGTEWEVEAVVTTELEAADGKTIFGVDVVDLHRLLGSEDVLLATTTRASRALIAADKANDVVVQLRLLEGMSDEVLDSAETSRALRSARWSEDQPGDYLLTYAQWLLSDGLTALDEEHGADPGDAAYPLGVLLSLDSTTGQMEAS